MNEKIELPLKNSGPHPLMSSVNREELVEMKSMEGVSLQELESMFKAIEQQVKEFEEKIKTLNYEKDKLALKWTEDNQI